LFNVTSGSREVLGVLASQLRTHVPMIAKYLELDLTVADYSDTLRLPAEIVGANEGHNLILSAAREVCQRILGKAKADRLQPADVAYLNIVDHHQLLNHPLLLGTNVIANASKLTAPSAKGTIVTLSCSNITPSNAYLQFGLKLCGKSVPYFSTKEYRDAIAYVKFREYDFVERLQKLKRWNQFEKRDQAFLLEYQRLLNNLDYSRCVSHSDQITIGVEACWPLLFASEMRQSLPSLCYVNAEELTSICFRRLLSEANFISAAILDSKFRGLVVERFRGIVTAWDEARHKGTHFFWRRVPDSAKLLRMYVQGNELVPTDGRFQSLRVPLEASSIIDHLSNQDILPSVALTATVLLYAGVNPLVGPGSLIYYGALQENWISLLSSEGFNSDAEHIKSIQVRGLIAGAPLFFAKEDGQLKALYAGDVIVRGGISAAYMKAILNRRFGDVLSVGCGEYYDLYRSYIPGDKWIDKRITIDQAATVVYGDTLDL
jgi:hypothetical protein